jgi:hypothetical protein
MYFLGRLSHKLTVKHSKLRNLINRIEVELIFKVRGDQIIHAFIPKHIFNQLVGLSSR